MIIFKRSQGARITADATTEYLAHLSQLATRIEGNCEFENFDEFDEKFSRESLALLMICNEMGMKIFTR